MTWTGEYQADYFRFHLEVAAAGDFVDFAAVQSIARVGGLNIKGVFTRTRQPRMAAHALRELWVERAHAAPDRDEEE